jgi:PIN domain nuclease of toxin-antitoxin system
LLSIVTPWEIAIKVSIGKLPDPGSIPSLIERGDLGVLPVDLEHVARVKSLPLHHRDPFDRMLIAQALAEKLTLVSNEAVFDRYGVKRVWE